MISNFQAEVTRIIAEQWKKIMGTFSETEVDFLHQQDQKIFSIITVDHISKNGYRVQSRIESALQKVSKSVDKFLEGIEEDQIEIGIKKGKIRAKIQCPAEYPYKFTDNYLMLKFCKRATKIDYLNKKAQYLNDMMALLALIKHFCDVVREQKFYFKVTINKDMVKNYLSSFETEAGAVELKKSIEKMKSSLKGIRRSKSVTLTTVENTILQKALDIFDTDLNYFKDSGYIENIFCSYLDTDPIEGTKKALGTVCNQALEKPETSGQNIFKLAEVFANQIENKAKQFKPILFLLLSRVVFSEIYENYFSEKLMNAIRGIGRYSLLRKYPPDYFGIKTTFLPPKLVNLPIENFPKSNEYETVISILKLLPYQYCPIDFCYYAYSAVQRMEEIASTISITEKVKNTGQIVALSDHALCTDDLIDILMILMLNAEPPDIAPLLKVFEPYINGLMLPQQFIFAFITFKTVCDKIDELDVGKFVENAKVRDAASYSEDPLGIFNFKSIV